MRCVGITKMPSVRVGSCGERGGRVGAGAGRERECYGTRSHGVRFIQPDPALTQASAPAGPQPSPCRVPRNVPPQT